MTRAHRLVPAVLVAAVGLAVSSPARAQDTLVPIAPKTRVSEAGPDGSVAFDVERPAVAYAPGADRFLVTWEQSDPDLPSDEIEIYTRILDGTGTPLGAPVRLTTTSGGGGDRDASKPDVAFDPGTGLFWVTYDMQVGPNRLSRAFVQPVTTAGLPDGAAFDVSDPMPDFDRANDPSIACAPTGDRCVVVFGRTVDVPPIGGIVDDQRASARVFMPSTRTALGTPQFLATTPDFNRGADLPDVTATGTAGAPFVASWRHEEAGGDEETYVRAIGLDGTPLAAQIPLTSTGNVVTSGLSSDPAGRVLVTWRGVGVIDSRLLDGSSPALTPLAPERTLTTGTDDGAPAVVFEPLLDRWLVIFGGRKATIAGLDATKSETFARTLDRDGVPTETEVVAVGIGDPADASAQSDEVSALVARTGRGSFLAVAAGDDPTTPGLAVGEEEVYARAVGIPGFPPAPGPPAPPLVPVTPAVPTPPAPPASAFEDPAATPADVALACAGRAIALVDVVPTARGRVLVTGAARADLVGRRLDVREGRTVVGRVTVRPDRTFRATVRGPRSAAARSRARYTVGAGRTTSRALKLARRMSTTSLRRSGGRTVFSGRVLPPLARPRTTVVVERQTSCTGFVAVATVRATASGAFTARFADPTAGAVVYRARTRVPQNTRSRRLFPTFTLPRPLGL